MKTITAIKSLIAYRTNASDIARSRAPISVAHTPKYFRALCRKNGIRVEIKNKTTYIDGVEVRFI